MSVIGLTLPISASLNVPEADIAFLVLAFALTFCFTAPLAQVIFSKLARVRILILGLVLMASGLGLAVNADSFEMLFFTRVLMGTGGGLITPMCSAIGAGLAAPTQQGRAMSVVFSGLTIASVMGVPVAAYLGTLIGWRPVMGIIALIALLIAVIVLFVVKDRSVGDAISLHNLFTALTQKRSSLALMTTFLQMSALFCTYALLAPYVIDKFSVAPEMIAVVLFVYGICGVIGNSFSGALSDRFGNSRIILITFVGMIAAFITLWLFPPYIGLGMLGFATIALFGMSFHSPQQQRIANIEPAKRSLYLALNASALYLGISTGSWISNLVALNFGYSVLPLTSAAVLCLCVALFLYSPTAANQTTLTAGTKKQKLN